MREKINASMSIMRQLADAGIGILAAAALTRSRDGKGRSSYDGKHLSLGVVPGVVRAGIWKR